MKWHVLSKIKYINDRIHGYDLQVIAFINEYEYVSGADEKVELNI